MKKMSIWMFAVFFVLQCCISGCTQFDDSSSGTLGEASTSTTTHTSIVDEETSVFEEFKSVEELLYWIHNDNGKGSMFRQAIKGLQLDRIMIIEAVDDTFTLEYIRTFQKGSGCDAQIEYYFISEKGERVGLFVQLKYMHRYVDDIQIYVDNNNLDNDYLDCFESTYRDITVNTEDATVS